MLLFLFIFFVPFLGASESSLIQRYDLLHASSLQRLVVLENKIDGISDEVRALLKDRKRTYSVDFKEKGKVLDEPMLTNAVITERKRLEKEEAFLEEVRKSPVLAKQLERKIASNLVALEATNILVTFVEFLDEYNRGVKIFPGPKDPEVMKVLAATRTALIYSKTTKEQMALADPQIIKLCQTESDVILKLLNSGLGNQSEDTLLPIPDSTTRKERQRLELQRLKKTKNLIKMIDQLATLISLANKPLSDEYQYHVLLLGQKLKEKRELSNTLPKN